MWLCWSKHLLCTCVHLSTQMHRKWSLKASSYSTVHKCRNKWPPHECRRLGQKVMSVSAHVDLRCTPNKPPVKQNDEKNDSDWKFLSHTHVAHHQQVTLLSWCTLRPNPEQAGRGEIGLVYYTSEACWRDAWSGWISSSHSSNSRVFGERWGNMMFLPSPKQTQWLSPQGDRWKATLPLLCHK